MQPTPNVSPYRPLAIAGGIAAVLVVLFTFEDYGVTWDEFYHIANGKHVLAYYATLFADRTVLAYHNLYLYGGVFDGMAALASQFLPFGDYQTSNLLNALVGLLGIWGCGKLAGEIAGRRAGLFAAVFLILNPSWYGHMFNNPKDIPFAAAMAWALYFMARTVKEFPAVPLRTVVGLGATLGLTVGMRVGGVIAFFYLGVATAAYLAIQWRNTRSLRTAWIEGRSIALRCMLPVTLIAYAVMLLSWPWAQQSPILNPLRALRLFSHISWDLNVLFDGRLVNSLRLPADYLFVYFAVKLPEPILVLLALAVVLAALAIRRNRAFSNAKTLPGYALLTTAIVFPFAYFVLARPVTYDGIRHFLFVLPPISAAAGITADRLFTLATRRGPALHAALAAAFTIWVGWQTSLMIRLHPHQYVYYNSLVGGVNGAQARFELDYWGNSYHEAVDLLNEYL
ncbi:MAG: glycosyltransferase family 39 protein, partial [Rhodospirillales bacterium]|nr:glycosyltransferase family 39 protein [Rhodospirillales bacterium]